MKSAPALHNSDELSRGAHAIPETPSPLHQNEALQNPSKADGLETAGDADPLPPVHIPQAKSSRFFQNLFSPVIIGDKADNS